MRNSWEDKFFSMLMLDANEQQNGGNAANAHAHAIMDPTPMGNKPNINASPVVSNEFVRNSPVPGEGDLSSVSSSDMP
jgi:hypothetical protein